MMRFLLAGLLMVQCARAADLSGTWTFTMTGANGLTSNPVVVLEQNRESLTGIYKGRFGESKLTGTVNGKTVTLDTETSGGKLHFTGEVDSKLTISGKFELAGTGVGSFTAVKK